MTRRFAVLLATGAAVLLLGACGDGENEPRRGLPANTVLVTQRDVLKEAPRSPERTLMSWWRAMQYTDARGYLAMLAEPVRRARQADGAHRVQLPIIARYVESGFPHIKKVTIAGDSATAYVEIEFRRLVGSDKYASTRVPQAFTLVRENRVWRVADDLFVEAGVDDELRRRARELGASGGAAPQARTVTVERDPAAVPRPLPAPNATPAP